MKDRSETDCACARQLLYMVKGCVVSWDRTHAACSQAYLDSRILREKPLDQGESGNKMQPMDGRRQFGPINPSAMLPVFILVDQFLIRLVN